MKITAQLKDQWLGIVIATALGVYFFAAGAKTRDPYYAVDPNRVDIVTAANLATAPIKVYRRDNTPITSDVFAIRFFFWNSGKLSIRPENVLDTIQIELADSASEILDYKVISTSRPITGVSLERGSTARALTVRFRILERGDGFGAQIIYQGKRQVPLRVLGNIEDASIRQATEPSIGGRFVAAAVAGVEFIVGGMALSMVGLFVIARFVVPFVGRVWPRSLIPSPKGAIALYVILVVALIVGAGYIFVNARPRAVTSYVPAELAR